MKNKNVYLDLDNMAFIRLKVQKKLSYFKRKTGWRQVQLSYFDNQFFPAKANPRLMPFVWEMQKDSCSIKAMTASVSNKGAETLAGLGLLTNIPERDILNWSEIEHGSVQRLPGRNCLVDDRGITSANTLRKLCFMHGVTWQQFTELPDFKQFNLAIAMSQSELVIVPPYFGQAWYRCLMKYAPITKQKLSKDPIDTKAIIESGARHPYFKTIERKVRNNEWYTLNKSRNPKEHKRSGRQQIMKPLIQLVMCN